MSFDAPIADSRNAPLGQEAFQEELWLLGQPPLSDYLDFVRRSVEDGHALEPRTLVDDWRAANDHYHDLESREAGIADEAGFDPLPRAMRPLAKALLEHPHVRRAFDKLPVEIRLVELDRLVVYQPHVAMPFVRRLEERLDRAMGPEALFRFCLPTDRRDPPVRVRRLDERRWLFASDSTDFRPHEPVLLRPDQVTGHEGFGPVGAVLGLAVGFGPNLLSVIRSGGRMLLHNGYHRAYALRAAGFTHAPALVQTVTRRDELQLVAPAAVVEEPAFFFASRRPPLVKDFFDPRIARTLSVRRMEKLVEVTLEVREHDLPLA